MRGWLPTLFIVIVTSSSLWHRVRAFSRVCYFSGSGSSRNGGLSADMIDVDLCTHVIKGFFSVSHDGSLNLDGIGGLKAILEFAALKLRNPDLKLLLSVGGGGGNNTDFKRMVSAPESVHR